MSRPLWSSTMRIDADTVSVSNALRNVPDQTRNRQSPLENQPLRHRHGALRKPRQPNSPTAESDRRARAQNAPRPSSDLRFSTLGTERREDVSTLAKRRGSTSTPAARLHCNLIFRTSKTLPLTWFRLAPAPGSQACGAEAPRHHSSLEPCAPSSSLKSPGPPCRRRASAGEQSGGPPFMSAVQSSTGFDRFSVRAPVLDRAPHREPARPMNAFPRRQEFARATDPTIPAVLKVCPPRCGRHTTRACAPIDPKGVSHAATQPPSAGVARCRQP